MIRLFCNWINYHACKISFSCIIVDIRTKYNVLCFIYSFLNHAYRILDPDWPVAMCYSQKQPLKTNVKVNVDFQNTSFICRALHIWVARKNMNKKHLPRQFQGIWTVTVTIVFVILMLYCRKLQSVILSLLAFPLTEEVTLWCINLLLVTHFHVIQNLRSEFTNLPFETQLNVIFLHILMNGSQ